MLGHQFASDIRSLVWKFEVQKKETSILWQKEGKRCPKDKQVHLQNLQSLKTIWHHESIFQLSHFPSHFLPSFSLMDANSWSPSWIQYNFTGPGNWFWKAMWQAKSWQWRKFRTNPYMNIWKPRAPSEGRSCSYKSTNETHTFSKLPFFIPFSRIYRLKISSKTHGKTPWTCRFCFF